LFSLLDHHHHSSAGWESLPVFFRVTECPPTAGVCQNLLTPKANIFSTENAAIELLSATTEHYSAKTTNSGDPDNMTKMSITTKIEFNVLT